MKMNYVATVLCLGTLFFAGTSHAAKVTFTNVSPQLEVTLRTDPTNFPNDRVSIATNGDVTAQCALNNTNTPPTCVGVPVGGGTPPGPAGSPSVSLSVSAAPAGGYIPTTSITLTTGVTTNAADVCFRPTPTGTPGQTIAGWSDTPVLAPVQGTTAFTFSAAAGTYVFTVKCYNTAGGQTATPISITIVPGGTPQPSGCVGPPPALPSGFTLPTGTEPQNLATTWGAIHEGRSFPFTAGNFWAYFVVTRNVVSSVQFTTPAAPFPTAIGIMSFQERHGTSIGTMPPEAVVMSISPCLGDFRPGMLTPPVGEEYRSIGCKNWLEGAPRGSMNFGPTSGFASCGLKPSTTYYLNTVLGSMDTLGTITPSVCPGGTSVTYCGLAIRTDTSN